MAETIPGVIAEYLLTTAGRTMLEGAVWFRWNLNDRRVEASSNQLTLPPEKMSVAGTMVFVRDGSRWQRYA